MKLNIAWSAWKAATRCLLWTLVDIVVNGLALRKEAARQLASLHPNRPQDLFDADFVVFTYELGWDKWSGYWRKPGSSAGEPAFAEFEVLMARDWGSIPWHPAKFQEYPRGLECRAVARSYALKNLRTFGLVKEAA